MALPTTLSFGNFKVYLGDGANPENFTASAAFIDKSLKLKAATGSTEVPDYDNPDLPMWEELEVKTLSVEVTGTGVLAMADLPGWVAWWQSGAAKDIRIMFNTPGAQGGGYLQGSALLTDFSPTGKKGEKTSMSVTIAGTAAFSWVPNP